MAAQIARNAATATLIGAFSVGLGALVRNQVVAIVGALVLGFAVEPTVIALLSDVGRFAPFVALPSAVQGMPADQVGHRGAAPLGGWAAAGLMLAWIAAAFAAGTARLRASDVV